MVIMQAGKMKVYFRSSRDRECCLPAVSITHRQAGIFRSLFGKCWHLRLHGHNWLRACDHLIRRTGVLSHAVSFALETN